MLYLHIYICYIIIRENVFIDLLVILMYNMLHVFNVLVMEEIMDKKSLIALMLAFNTLISSGCSKKDKEIVIDNKIEPYIYNIIMF